MTVIAMKEITGRHVLIAFIAFFGVMLTANGIFLYFALSTFNGLDNPNAYQEGLQYNQRIEAARRQTVLGWSHGVALLDAGRIELTVKDRTGNPVSGLAVSGTIGRPVTDEFTQALTFEETGLGLYAAKAHGLQPGNWIVSLEAAKSRTQGLETVYRIKERLWLKPNS